MSLWSKKMGTTKSIISTLGSVAATAMVARSIINEFLPQEAHDYIHSTVRTLFTYKYTSDITMVIDEFDGCETNLLFDAAKIYLASITKSSLSSSSTIHSFRVTKPDSENSIRVVVDKNEEMVDEFNDTRFRWVFHCEKLDNAYSKRKTEIRSFNLIFHKKDKVMAVEEYLPHILKQAEMVKQKTQNIKLYKMDYEYDGWTSIGLNHPATFETLAMDSDVKAMIIEDLDRFVRRKEYYRRVGKAWKRGYLLYGPPGTGKSSLIAAMANYLNFDIYDLQLSGLDSDSNLRDMLVGTTNRSILIIEDIDCAIQFKDREAGDANVDAADSSLKTSPKQQVTLAGLLNFIDGLWSSCGDERIIIFTTNHKDKLDPALLRPGRMDMHILMSYCTPCGFKFFAKNYLGITDHELFAEIESLILEVEVTPAQVAEQLMKHDEPEQALKGLLNFLRLKKTENEEIKDNKIETKVEVNDDKFEKLSKKHVED